MLTKKNSLILMLVVLLAAVVYWLATSQNDKYITETNTQPISSSKAEQDDFPISEQTVRNENIVVDEISATLANTEITKTEEMKTNVKVLTEDEIQAQKAEMDAIEKDMMLSAAPEGDVSYMSPEYETSQPLGETEFPAVEPDSIYTELGEKRNNSEKIGQAIEK